MIFVAVRAVSILALLLCTSLAEADELKYPLEEQSLPPLPESIEGAIVGRSGGALLVVGGRDTEGKSLSARAFVLADGAAQWQVLKIETPVADAAFVTVGDEIVYMGGETTTGIAATAFRVRYVDGELVSVPLPGLPAPIAQAGAVAIGEKLYLVGGLGRDGNPVADNFLSLDLAEPSPWQILPACPLSGLHRPIVAAQAGDVLVFGGPRWVDGARRHSTDSWRYRAQALDATVESGWLDMSDLPAPWHAATAFATGQSHVMVLGGPRDAEMDERVVIYHTIIDAYTTDSAWSNSIEAPTAIIHGKEGVQLVGRNGAITASFRHVTKTLHGLDYAVIAVYLAIIVGIGLYFSKREKTTQDFFLGGRKIPWWAVGISLYATGTSAISFMAIPTKAWATSTLYGIEGLVGLLGMVAAAYLVIPIIRRLDITSTYEYLERRYNPWLCMWGSGLNIVFQLAGRMSVVLLLPSLALSAVTGFPVLPVIAALGALATVYTVFGGLAAVIWTDVLQVVVLLGGALLAFIIMISGSDGGAAGWWAINMDYNKIRVADLSFDYAQPVIWIVMLNAVLHIGTATSDQVMVQRVLATPDVRAARRSYLTLALIVLPGSLLFTFLGTAMFSYFRAHPEMLNPTMENIHALPMFIVNGLPAGVSGLVIAGLFAASMSSLDSSMNSVSTLLVIDFYKRFRPHATDQRCLSLGKWLTAAVGFFGTGAALLMATTEIKSMFDMWSQLVALVLGGFGGVFVLGMFTRRANGWGALLGAVSSIGITVAIKTYTDLHFMAYGSVAVLSCVAIGYVSSLFLPHREVDLRGLTVYALDTKNNE
ncbi:MAG: sodium:solute symporter family transporter [Candidatus Latescibacterota bacterium]|jgi:SSS family solute:Na+ symporter